MARVLITGSADGLGRLAAQLLVEDGHDVVLHARSAARATDAKAALPEAAAVIVGDVSTLAGMREVAAQATTAGPFDAVIHNVAVGYQERRRIETPDGLAHVFAINVLAPYVLTALIPTPARLVYLSSGMHRGGDPGLSDAQWERRSWNGSRAYSDSKLFDAMLAATIARQWPDVRSNAVNPGWVPTAMGGPGAPDDLRLGALTQSWLAASDDPAADVTGRYFYHQRPESVHPSVRDERAGQDLLDYCAQLSGIQV